MPKKGKPRTPIYDDVAATVKATWPTTDQDKKKKKPKGKKKK